MTASREVEGDVRRDGRKVRLPVPCTSYASGHHAHWIQWSHAYREKESQHPATVLEIGDETFTIELDAEPVQLYHHDLGRLGEIVALQGPEIVEQFAWSVVWFGSYLISVRHSGPLEPCPQDQPVGGATVPLTTPEETADRLYRALVPDADPAEPRSTGGKR